jgi:site-specific recombinase XerD
MIIDKYKYSNALILGKVLPQITNQKLNMYLKTIADLSGIDIKLTHHIARHTCGTLLLNNGVGLEIVQKILGHENIRTTQIYAKSSIKTISNQVLTAFKNINNG